MSATRFHADGVGGLKRGSASSRRCSSWMSLVGSSWLVRRLRSEGAVGLVARRSYLYDEVDMMPVGISRHRGVRYQVKRIMGDE